MRARDLALLFVIFGCSEPSDRPSAVDAPGGSSAVDAAGDVEGPGDGSGGGPREDASPATGGDCNLVEDTGCPADQTCKVDLGWVLDSGVIAATSDPACVSARGGLSDYRCSASDQCIAGWSCLVLVGYDEGECVEPCRTADDCTPADGVDWGCHPVDGLGDIGFCDELVSF